MGSHKKAVFRSVSSLRLRSLVYGLIGGGVIGLIASGFMPDGAALAVGAAFFCVMAYSALIGDDIEIAVDGEVFVLHRHGKERLRFRLAEAEFRANFRTSGAGADCLLTVRLPGGGIRYIDCSSFGEEQFMRLLDSLGDVVYKPGKK